MNKLKTYCLLILTGFFILLNVNTYAQQNVGIGTNTPDPSALLELSSVSKGLLVPRMTTAQRLLISFPDPGLLVYDTNVKAFYYWDGTQWVLAIGPIGPTGPSGAQGLQGTTGLQGIQGFTGIPGTTGIQGPTGLQGLMGPIGNPGLAGATGPTGNIGLTGATGLTGQNGINGVTGPTGIGVAGVQGATGPTGIGVAGAQVPTVPSGTDGIDGAQGTTGLQGVTGSTGSAFAHYVGELYGCGVVFWVDQTGDHGLICSMIDNSTGIVWTDSAYQLIPVPAPGALSDWDGQANTIMYPKIRT